MYSWHCLRNKTVAYIEIQKKKNNQSNLINPFLSQRHHHEAKHKQHSPVFELESAIPFSTTVNVRLSVPLCITIYNNKYLISQ